MMAGLCGLTRAQAVSLDKRVRVNAILPGWIVNSKSLEVSQEDRDWHLVGASCLQPRGTGVLFCREVWIVVPCTVVQGCALQQQQCRVHTSLP